MRYLKIIISNKKYFEDFITRSTYNSNAIEGSTLSIHETYALLFDSNYCNISNASPREIYEAINHKKIMEILVNKIQNNKNLTNDFLIEMNKTINENIMYIGGYRLGVVRIIGSSKTFPMPNELEQCMEDFIKQFNNLFKEETTLKDVAKMHIQFENIHPFPDGNGRTLGIS